MKMSLRRKLSDEVRIKLEELIRDDVYPEGSSLPSERELMEMFDVGRPSIREALFGLEKMGLIKIKMGEKARVTRPTPQALLASLSGVANILLDSSEGVQNFEQARIFLEGAVARYAAENATPAQIEALEEALRQNEQTIMKPRAFAITDVAFHRLLTSIPDNPIFMAMHDALVDWMINQRPLPKDEGISNTKSFEGHVAIFNAIRDHKPIKAMLAMEEHLKDVQKRYRGIG
ncbi:transcriptional regulator NanR [uncultured Cohaesibacter sp.]|uniref:transcriptional regulator NanR n=1 Tax=uncultured Cohaesibacter sp. TaxID=1002546 RepID=UPI0029C99B67|nr:transcriptional regulator NanR [uncultured Cohaesibacter sp.]